MSLQIKLLGECQQHLHAIAHLWVNEIGKKWEPQTSVQRAEQNFREHFNTDSLPLTFVVIEDDQPIAMASLRESEGIREELTPWLGSLIVHPDYRRKGMGQKLVDLAKLCTKKLGYDKLYLCALDPTLPNWYTRIGWKYIGMDKIHQHPVTVMETDV